MWTGWCGRSNESRAIWKSSGSGAGGVGPFDTSLCSNRKRRRARSGRAPHWSCLSAPATTTPIVFIDVHIKDVGYDWTMNRQLKHAAKRVLMKAHEQALRMGVVVLPKHYYVPIADVLELKKTRDIWARRCSMHGVDIDITQQAARLQQMVRPFEAEYRGNLALKEAAAQGFGPGFGYIEAQCLHGVLRSLKPRRIIEVGSGVSTYCAVKATALNAAEGKPAEITCIEPYPSAYLRGSGDIRLIIKKAQELAPAEFDRLEDGDFLFIDSSHAVKPGGDVLYLYLEVLPRLKPGVVIHIHDIYFPYLYQRNVLESFYQWTETAILQALLTNNQHLKILFSMSMLHYDVPDDLKKVFPEYSPAPGVDGLADDDLKPGHFPSSIYLQTS
jgi:predicted O-methyltransferase YrrM